MTIWTNKFNKQLDIYMVEPVCSADFVVSIMPCRIIDFKGRSVS